ncbi:hypothetical protein VTN77DRAFT_199 [Rasamsonia byssochlamydoides]|uniref:uncharacterized protein n=1 Tax=Rasamsonia byssochlamydoides TaxID=89139 RepID=UPI003742EA21
MLDPLPPPPPWLRGLVTPWAVYFNLHSLPNHIHEILFAFAFYQFVHSYLSPRLSAALFPQFYPRFPRRTQLNWDVHVVSFLQSTLINLVALWVMFADRERKDMTAEERVYGYTGACGLVQALATGYFLYDLIVSTVYVKMFGVGMLFHAISALWVFAQGFRPFVNFYAPTFILYELSSPFLNIHWFLDKVNMTGSKAQWYNGITLLVVFFFCRLVWGTWQSALVYMDMWRAVKQTWSAPPSSVLDPVNTSATIFQERNGTLCVDEACARANAEISLFAHQTAAGVPIWLVLTYVASNLILNGLNYYWFSKMIEAVMKRFREPAIPAKKVKEPGKEVQPDVVLDAAGKLREEEGYFETGDGAEQTKTSVVDTLGTDMLRKRKS